ncbi:MULTISPECIES: type II toxin-antitoxin system Phd/YefM family antitoxin [Halomonadaceae]|uniref:Antitoxin n=1 Tax=Modicisalibacter zincidurans TaxID=1178777 RepID=A0ABP9RKW0_9GAMM|nr:MULTISPECIES: type II toxin-antitoxin system prevent-host-death family antitoxin [Halomonas]MCD6009670.1 type II toxin-antitoxin system prevent-host-death family antitoxin [Halomonas sp. IOP_31]|tara:strand:- start:402 stop:641 length:240 start_codon:yes stop_codon:yes gene_type:complete
METVNIHEAKTRLSQLLAKAAQGEGFVIARAGKPIAKVTAINSPDADQQKRLGFMKDQFKVPEDFDRMGQNEIADLFEG